MSPLIVGMIVLIVLVCAGLYILVRYIMPQPEVYKWD